MIFNMRHGETPNLKGCFDLRDVELTTLGHLQARRAGVLSRGLGIAKIVHGPSIRHIESTTEFLSGLGYAPDDVVEDPGAAELRYVPHLHGRDKQEVYGEAEVVNLALRYQLGLHLHNSESVLQVADRMRALYARHSRNLVGNLLVITSQQPAVAPQAVSQGLNRDTYRQLEVPHASIAVYDPADPGVRTPLTPAQLSSW